MQGEWLVPIFEKQDSNYVRSTNLSKVVFALKTKELCFIFYLYWNEKKNTQHLIIVNIKFTWLTFNNGKFYSTLRKENLI